MIGRVSLAKEGFVLLHHLTAVTNFFDEEQIYTVYFFFSSRRRHTILTCDWSSDVCSSDLIIGHSDRSDIGADSPDRATASVVDFKNGLVMSKHIGALPKAPRCATGPICAEGSRHLGPHVHPEVSMHTHSLAPATLPVLTAATSQASAI